MSVLSKTNVIINNKWLSRFLKIIPDFIAMKWLDKEKKKLANKGILNHKNAFMITKTKGRIKILFILYKPHIWNSQKTVYDAAINNPEVEVFVVVVPNDTILSDGRVLESYSYYNKQCPGAINALQDGRIFDVRKLHPDIIIRQSPYDHEFPEQYSMANLAKIAKTCYIPYSYNYTPNHLHIEYNTDLLSNLYAVFSDCLTNYNYCLKEHQKWYPDLHVYYYGFPRFDIIRKMQNRTNTETITFTWITRWNADTVNNDGTSFFDYKDCLLNFFSNHPNINLIIRPHPNMFDHFIKLGLMTSKEVSDYKENVRIMSNVCMDDNMDYLQTFEQTNVLIADMSSINFEFYLTGKPIIFCGDPSHFNEETKNMNKLMYLVSNWDDLKKQIEEILNGNDPNYDLRKKDIDKIIGELPSKIGEAVVDKCIEIVRENK